MTLLNALTYEHLTDEDITTEQRCVEDSEEHSGGAVIQSVARESQDGIDVCKWNT